LCLGDRGLLVNDRILLLGANGLLGKVFVSEFHRRGIPAHCLGHSDCDVTDPAQVNAVFDRLTPEIAINCTAYTKVDLADREADLAFAINGTAVGNLARAAAAHGTRLVHYSTDFVFDGKSDEPYQPADPVAPMSVYGESKLRGETLLQEIDPPGWIIARTSWLFGTTGPCFPRTILDRARKGQPLKIVNDQIGSPTYAPDLALATLDLLDKGGSGIRHLTNSGECSWFEFAQAIVGEFGIKGDISPTTTAEFLQMRPEQARRPAFSVMGDGELGGLLGRTMRPWKEALADYRAASLTM
jgi:dTDP-4-dehydrorhamnose reductase